MIRASTPIAFFAALQAVEEPRRHACEVRMVAAIDTDSHRSVYLEGVRDKRGRDAALLLRQDVWHYLRNNNQLRQEVLFA